MNQYLFYDDLNENFQDFLPSVTKLVSPEFSVGTRQFKSEKEYGKWYIEQYSENKYAQYLEKTNDYDYTNLDFGGLSISEIQKLTSAVENGQGVKSVCFDWDKTISICEGFLKIDPLAKELNVSIEELLNDMIPFILGDDMRQTALSQLFSALQQGNVRVFILTNNVETNFPKLLSVTLSILNVPNMDIRLIQQQNSHRVLKKSKLLQNTILKMPIDNVEKDELMTGYFGKSYESANTNTNKIGLFRTSSSRNHRSINSKKRKNTKKGTRPRPRTRTKKIMPL